MSSKKIEIGNEKKVWSDEDKNFEKEDTNKKKVSEKEKTRSNVKPRSIAVQFIFEKLTEKFFGKLFFDIAYIVLLMGAFVYNAEMTVNGSLTKWGRIAFLSEGSGLREFFVGLKLVVYNASGESRSFLMGHYGEFLFVTLSLIAAVQIIVFLVQCLIIPIKINRKLKPLYTMTQATKALKNVDLTSEEFATLQDAINNLSPNKPDQKIHTGKTEFIGMEDAINDLLERTRNSYKSQIRFVSDAAHELRTPIAVIQGYANMLDRWGREDKEILNESIISIKSEAENMNRLVENLLFLARGDSGRTVLRIEKININQLLCDIYDEFVMIDATHEFRLDLRADITSKADASLLKQCLRILVDNAIKYSAEGTDIILRLQKKDENSFSIEVQDYGIGIKSEDADKIFERFYRSDPARNRQNGGSGLGLSIAKWIAEKHNGYFELLSYENIGTRISLVLPLTYDETEKTEDTDQDTVDPEK